MDGRNPSLEAILAELADRAPSFLLAHQAACCQTARVWFASMARSVGAQEVGPPLWIRERWQWGPIDWPLYWCEAMAAERLDCGALAALGCSAVETLGGAALPVQLVEQFDTSAIESWRDSWQGAKIAPWTWVDFAYHEAIALLDGTRVSIWDTTAACWLDQKATAGYAALAAIRIWPLLGRATPPEPPSVLWRDRWFQVGVWHRMLERSGE